MIIVEAAEKDVNIEMTKAKSKTNEDYMHDILKYIAELKNESKEKKLQDEFFNEWKCIALIVDRTLFWFAFLVLAISVPTMLLVRDELHD